MDPDNPAPVFEALHLPPDVLEQGGVEVLRAIIVDGALQVSIRPAFDDPEPWGMLIADVTRHIARIYASQAKLDEAQVVARVRASYAAELDHPTDPAATRAVS